MEACWASEVAFKWIPYLFPKAEAVAPGLHPAKPLHRNTVVCQYVIVHEHRPCGLMDKVLVFNAKDCRFEPCQGQCLLLQELCRCPAMGHAAQHKSLRQTMVVSRLARALDIREDGCMHLM